MKNYYVSYVYYVNMPYPGTPKFGEALFKTEGSPLIYATNALSKSNKTPITVVGIYEISEEEIKFVKEHRESLDSLLQNKTN